MSFINYSYGFVVSSGYLWSVTKSAFYKVPKVDMPVMKYATTCNMMIFKSATLWYRYNATFPPPPPFPHSL